MIITNSDNIREVIKDFNSSDFDNVDKFKDYFKEYVRELDDDDWEPFYIYIKNFYPDYCDMIFEFLDAFYESYCGFYSSPEEFCEILVDSNYDVSGFIYPYIDFKSMSLDLFSNHGDYVFKEGYVFKTD